LDPELFPELSFSIPETSYWTYERAMTSVALSKVINACDKDATMDFEYYGYAEGFKPSMHFEGPRFGGWGVVGTLPRENAIYVIFRAAVAEGNSLKTDLDVQLTDYVMWPECNCRAHRGYQNATLEVYS